MDEEQLTQKAIDIARSNLERALIDPRALIEMTASGVDSHELQDRIYDLLEYLEETDPERDQEAEE